MIGRNGTRIGALGLARGVVENNDRSVSDLNRAACTGSGKSCILQAGQVPVFHQAWPATFWSSDRLIPLQAGLAVLEGSQRP